MYNNNTLLKKMFKLQNGNFVDAEGRIVHLRGVNLGGSSKVPAVPDGATWKRAGFYDSRNASFIGRPFPLEAAGEHFSRLKAWGLTFLRFLITWEAVEHAGPGIYDEAYLDYLYEVVKTAGDYGFCLFIDPHQDVWSRFTGGDGAPGWTLEDVGIDATRLHAAGAAFLHQEHEGVLPHMIWPVNYNRFAAATLFTLFFGGSDFTPKTLIDGIPVQEYFQSHYINAVKQVAARLKGLPHVIGYDTLNEPSAGFIGAQDVAGRAKVPLLKGESPTIFQSMLLASGYPQEVDVFELGLSGFVKKGTRVANRGRQSIWLAGHEDIWKQNGVWGLDPAGRPEILAPDYFCTVGGREVNFYRDYFKPFANRFAREVRSVSPDAIIFVEGVPTQGDLTWSDQDAPDIVHAAHWYDGMTLMNKSFRKWFTVDPRSLKIRLGAGSVRHCFADQVADILRQSEEHMNHAPTLVGEVGIPFDMQKKRAYRTGDFSMQIQALDASICALENNFANFTLWNYTADNTNQRGDHWNGEDFSIYSKDQQTGSGDIYDGGRALQAVIRPYAARIPGQPLSQSFDIRGRIYRITFRHDPLILAPLVVFLPAYHYPNGAKVAATRGMVRVNPPAQVLEFWPAAGESIHTLTITPD